MRVRRSAEDSGSGEQLLHTSTSATDQEQTPLEEEILVEMMYAGEKAKHDLGNDRATLERLVKERIEAQAQPKPRESTNR